MLGNGLIQELLVNLLWDYLVLPDLPFLVLPRLVQIRPCPYPMVLLVLLPARVAFREAL